VEDSCGGCFMDKESGGLISVETGLDDSHFA
jgi:hypothetical protein